ncbi:O-antigen/teichoic acid export membrane protein [Neorhizobium galegae]|uniref:lipopolysaccharide biosynthesis protein n=1 Tax=Neorhizobium galegae TaxID=399 RepID=UPI001AEACE0B|nr:oligosaccharide flippase family protein [Neorhizobium galegae]MBP2550526.1 O-antigen/teichoic acid export membrane protein [Neorhizobium galegae]
MVVNLVKPIPNNKARHGVRLLVNVAGAFGARGINLVIAFLTVPLALAGLGAHDYGIFAVILSAATFIAYADFGMGLAMVNPIATSEARGDHAETRRLISDTWSLLLCIAAVIFVVGAVTIGAFVLTETLIADNILAWLVLLAGVVIGLPAAITQRVLFALQRSYEANLWMSAGRVASLGGVYAAYQLHLGLWAYVFAMLCLPALVGWLNTARLFRYNRRDISPTFCVSAATMRRLMPEGLRYTILQIGPYIETGFDVVLIGSMLGPSQATSYDLITRAFNYIPALASVGVMPLWPAIAGAIASGNAQWAEKIRLLSSVALLVVTIIPTILLAIFHTQVLHLWTGLEIVFPMLSLAAFGFVAVSISFIGLRQSSILATEGPKRLFYLQIVFIAVLIPSKIASIWLFGIFALPLVTAFVYFFRYFAVFYIEKNVPHHVREQVL